MNSALYKNGVLSSIKTFFIIAAVMTMYFTIIVTMFDPEIGSALIEFEKAMPELMAMVGMNSVDTTLVGFMASYLYGFIVPIFPMIYAIIIANMLIARKVDSGNMAYLLASPTQRRKIVFTQMKVLLSGIFALMLFVTVIGIVACEASFPKELDISKFLLLNLGAFALHIFISGICFLASCIFNDSKYSIALGAGIPILSYIIQMMANAGDKYANAKYATFFTLFNPQGIIASDEKAYIGIAVLALVGFSLYAAANIIFTRKDMPV